MRKVVRLSISFSAGLSWGPFNLSDPEKAAIEEPYRSVSGALNSSCKGSGMFAQVYDGGRLGGAGCPHWVSQYRGA